MRNRSLPGRHMLPAREGQAEVIEPVIEQAADIVQSTATGTDRAQKYLFKATGGKLSQIFDGSEQLVSITSLPFYSRQVSLPKPLTQRVDDGELSSRVVAASRAGTE